MPRASTYLIKGYTYHLTHRCHNRDFHLRFARDRERYRAWLREGVRRFAVPIYDYAITHNHVHVVAHADDVEAVSRLMHLASGALAKHYNLRKAHLGSVWEHPYQCTLVQDGRHLLNCLCYVDLNMVRAGKVSRPRDWRWCGHDELMGYRKRYRVINMERLLQSLGIANARDFQELYAEAIAHRLEQGNQSREAHWTESLAVGSESFIRNAAALYNKRYKLHLAKLEGTSSEVWCVRESSDSSYGSI